MTTLAIFAGFIMAVGFVSGATAGTGLVIWLTNATLRRRERSEAR